MKDFVGFLSVIVAFVAIVGGILYPIGWERGAAEGRQEMRIAAVQNGVGRWVVDENGKSTFEWISAKEKK